MDLDSPPNTGSKTLDDDLERLWEFASDRDGSLAALREKLQQPEEPDESELSEFVPEWLPRILHALTSVLPSTQLRSSLSSAGQDEFDRAREFATDTFADLLHSPRFAKAVRYRMRSDLKEDSHSAPVDVMSAALTRELGAPANINHVSMLQGDPPKLNPTLRMIFGDDDGNVVGDWTLDWDDLSFVVHGLISAAQGQTHAYGDLKDHIWISPATYEKIEERFGESIEQLQDIRNTLAQMCPGQSDERANGGNA